MNILYRPWLLTPGFLIFVAVLSFNLMVVGRVAASTEITSFPLTDVKRKGLINNRVFIIFFFIM